MPVNPRLRQRTMNQEHTATISSYVSISNVMRGLVASYVMFVAWVQSPVLKHVLQETTMQNTSNQVDQVRKLSAEPIKQQLEPELEPITTQQKQPANFLPRVLAIVFPQFHQDPLNDRLWGEGFSDWNNLKKAPTHNNLGFAIPRPTELGYYNLAATEPRKRQGELANQYGIDGFIYHHYWFYDPKYPGQPVLHAPLMGMLQDGHPNLPFALHWCASKWTNTWSGAVQKDFVFEEPGVLQKQHFPANNDTAIVEHYQWLKQFFHHPNYIKVSGKPLFMIYQKKPGSYPIVDRLQQLAKADGFPGLYLTVGLTMPHSHLLDLDTPTSKRADYNDNPPQAFTKILQRRFQRPLAYPNPSAWNINRTLAVPEWCLKDSLPNQPRVPDIAGIISSFDNTPRRSYDKAHVWSAAEPAVVVERFQSSLTAALYYESCCFPDEFEQRQAIDHNQQDDRFVVINAMNEWAEGMALEPSDVYGRSFLEAIQAAKQQVREGQCHGYSTK